MAAKSHIYILECYLADAIKLFPLTLILSIGNLCLTYPSNTKHPSFIIEIPIELSIQPVNIFNLSVNVEYMHDIY